MSSENKTVESISINGVKFDVAGDEDERWMNVYGYDGLYVVSDMGRVFSVKRRKELGYVRCGRSKKYMGVELWRGNNRRIHRVHRVVLGAFIGEPMNGNQVDHINGTQHDNRLSNLEYVTQRENASRHYSKNGNGDIRVGVEQRGSKFRASISYQNTNYYLISSSSAIVCRETYLAAADSIDNGTFDEFINILRNKREHRQMLYNDIGIC